MKVIKENIVGLFRFIGLLFSVFILPIHKPQPQEAPDESDKYEALIGPSKPLVPTEAVFCPKCHVAVAQVRHTKRGTEIIQRGKVLITVGSNVIMRDGKEEKGFPMRCPNGHTVRIE